MHMTTSPASVKSHRMNQTAGTVDDAPPQGEYMNPEQLAWFERRLRSMRETTMGMLLTSQEGMGENVAMADDSDKATSIEAGSLATAQGDRLKAELRRIDEAIERIRNGEYGYCIDSGDEIGMARLMANPTACRTVEAQEAVEMRLRQRVA